MNACTKKGLMGVTQTSDAATNARAQDAIAHDSGVLHVGPAGDYEDASQHGAGK